MLYSFVGFFLLFELIFCIVGFLCCENLTLSCRDGPVGSFYVPLPEFYGDPSSGPVFMFRSKLRVSELYGYYNFEYYTVCSSGLDFKLLIGEFTSTSS